VSFHEESHRTKIRKKLFVFTFQHNNVILVKPRICVQVKTMTQVWLLDLLWHFPSRKKNRVAKLSRWHAIAEFQPLKKNFSAVQGDQIGRNFASWMSVFFGKFFGKLKQWPIFFGLLFRRSYVLILTKEMGGLHFGWFFLQTNLVTLLPLEKNRFLLSL
jgi:hypothetical protein